MLAVRRSAARDDGHALRGVPADALMCGKPLLSRPTLRNVPPRADAAASVRWHAEGRECN